MKWILKTAVIILLNAGAFTGIAYFSPKFQILGGFGQTLVLAAIFTLLNYILKPVLKLILGPVIIFTLGLGLIVVNMLLLYILDSLSKNLSIDGVLTLLYAAVIIGFVNFFIHLIFKKS